MKEKDFTRKRKQTFVGTIILILNRLTKSLLIEIENFIFYLNNYLDKNEQSFTDSAFIQNRCKINPLAFKELSKTLIDEFYTENDLNVKKWKGFRLLAVDGSIIRLPTHQKTIEIYGKTENNSESFVVNARVSVLYDVLNKFIIDENICPLSEGERSNAIEHLNETNTNDLIIYDRGYPSFELMLEHSLREIDFLMRVKKTFNLSVKAFCYNNKKTEIVKFTPSKKLCKDKPYLLDKSINVRLVKVELDNGEVEILITTLLDKSKYKNKIFKELYFKRWQVETVYDELKNKLKIEYFSGYTQSTILQDFYSTIFICNIQSLITKDIEQELNEKAKERQYEYKINTNLSYGFLKDRIIKLFFDEFQNSEETLKELKELFLKNIVPIRPRRKFSRCRKFRRRSKPKVLINSKNSF